MHFTCDRAVSVVQMHWNTTGALGGSLFDTLSVPSVDQKSSTEPGGTMQRNDPCKAAGVGVGPVADRPSQTRRTPGRRRTPPSRLSAKAPCEASFSSPPHTRSRDRRWGSPERRRNVNRSALRRTVRHDPFGSERPSDATFRTQHERTPERPCSRYGALALPSMTLRLTLRSITKP